MRYTLLDLTQKILSSMDGDEINSINDTTESQSVVNIIQTTYYDIAARAELPRHFGIFQLVPSDDITKPVTMSLPQTVTALNWIKYNTATVENPEMRMSEVRPLPLLEFLGMVLSLNSTEPNVFSYTKIVDGQTMTFQATNNRGPTYYTTFDDSTIIFDGYDAVVDSTLQASKTLCYGQKSFPWVNSDTFIPDLDDKQHQLLLNEAKSMCFAELKQTAHPKAEKNSRNLWINQQSAKTKVPLETALQKTPNYGR